MRSVPTERGYRLRVTEPGTGVMEASPSRFHLLLLRRVLPTNALEPLTIGLYVQEPAGLSVPLDPADRGLDL